MKITIVTDVLGVENNGTTITVKRLIENLKLRGHEVRVISPLDTDEDGYYGTKKRNFGIFNKYVEKNGVVLARVDREVLRKGMIGSDVVHIILPFQLGKAAIKVARELNIPTTSAFHCQPENVTAHFKLQNFEPVNRFVYRWFLRKFYCHQQYVHCPTDFIANQLRKYNYDMYLKVISNGVAPEYHLINIEKPGEFKDKYCIVTVGRLAREKRHDLLIKAIKLSKYEKQIQLIIAGTGPLEEQTKKLGTKLTNKPIFNFYPREELVKILNFADLYVHPADIEIEAIACLEAITCGLVPIISDSKKSATNAFALHEVNLFKAGDPQDLANKIDYMIEHPDAKEVMRREYLEYSKRFNLSACIDKMEEMFQEAVHHKED